MNGSRGVVEVDEAGGGCGGLGEEEEMEEVGERR